MKYRGLRKSLILELVRFGLVGTLGFSIDGGVLIALVHNGLCDPIAGRFVSFLVALLCTYTLNRAWTFRGKVGFWRGLRGYVVMQSLAFSCNILIYYLMYVSLKASYNSPIMCLAVASVLAMFVNYFGNKLIVFRDRSAKCVAENPGHLRGSTERIAPEPTSARAKPALK